MDVNFKLIIILVAAVMLLVLLIDAWLRERKLQMEIRYGGNKKDTLEYEPDDAMEYEEPSAESMDYKKAFMQEEVNDDQRGLSKNNSISKLVNKQNSSTNTMRDDFIVINVIAKHGGYFSSYDLLQAISATGMQYGAMNIFHYIEDTPRGKVTLFSLASATEPGEFDLNNIGGLMCAGLTLFMNISKVSDPGDVFVLMLETAEQLADDLGGELRAAPNIPWTEDVFHHYESKIINQQKLI